MSASVPWRPAAGAPPAMNPPPPAYNAVSARRSFDKPDSAPPPRASAPPKWPPSVRLYVQRSFAPDAMEASITREELEKTLKKVITEATEANALYTTDWDNHPLPQQLILAQRAKPANLDKAPWRNNNATPEKTMGDVCDGPFAKKRKSPEGMTNADDESLPPWRRTNKRRIEDRIEPTSPVVRSLSDRMEKRHHITPTNGSSKYMTDLEKRRQRFENDKAGPRSPRPWNTSSRDDSPSDVNDGPVVGICQNLEKRYLRLTAPPKPETVRPLHVLEKTLEHLKTKWKKEGNYAYICDQFKSLRQDLTVQHVKNEFTVTVYEIHARIALEKGDLGEYNQCQTQLRALYALNLGGHPAEFLAYRILYFIYTQNRTDMNEVLADLTPADKSQPAVKHALDVRSALALGNYHRFFRLYLDTPNMGAYLMDMFIERERLAALANMCKAYVSNPFKMTGANGGGRYKPHLDIRFLTDELGFESFQDCLQFVCDKGAQNFLEQKSDDVVVFHSSAHSAQLFAQAKAQAFQRVDLKGQM
ncbi:SAC3/GANP domain protein [Phyllosticta citriasiana]|uniref:SAC3/GANP domain protein n=1 Tax=Phyllosticta citriasiana TaxID=595635 RepID=UPI0030FDE108